MKKNAEQFIAENKERLLETLRELCAIPAPSHFEHKRAEYCKRWLEDIGAEGVYIDEALNVVYPLNCEKSREITVFVAHTDTVFPDMEPLPYREDEKNIYCPGVGDNTSGAAILLMLAKYFTENNIMPEKGILFVCNSCEEGLGDLKGTKKIFEDYDGRIGQFISLDGTLDIIANVCVGSHRYEVEVLTEGGHSFGDFGKKNAIDRAARIISKIYDIKVPEKEGAKTTYNVGTLSGGTSVNTIAQNANFLCEYRSDDVECLAYMQKQFEEIFESAKEDGVEIKITKVGERPCADIDPAKVERLKELIAPEIEAIIEKKVSFESSSTDCNVPLSKGVPAICVGTGIYKGLHTREEWIEKESVPVGLRVAICLAEKLMEV